MNLKENINRIKIVMGLKEQKKDLDLSPPPPTGAWALKYNNPMALIQSKPSDWDGLKGDNGGRLIFEEMWYGVRAGIKNLRNSYFNRGNNTLSGILKVYAPSGHGSNNPDSYAEFIAGKLGVGINDELNFDEHGKDIAKAIINMETGIPVGRSGGVSTEDFEKGYDKSLE